jgi:hypothetical protein
VSLSVRHDPDLLCRLERRRAAIGVHGVTGSIRDVTYLGP